MVCTTTPSAISNIIFLLRLVDIRKPRMSQSLCCIRSCFGVHAKQVSYKVYEHSICNLQMLLQWWLLWNYILNLICLLLNSSTITSSHFLNFNHRSINNKKLKSNLVDIINIKFLSEILLSLLPFHQHLKINRTKHSNHTCKNHDDYIIGKEHLQKTDTILECRHVN